MNSSQKKQKLGLNQTFLPTTLGRGTWPALLQMILLYGSLFILGLLSQSSPSKANNESENALPVAQEQRSPAKFVPPPDPSSLPSALLVPLPKAGQSSLDLLPSFPSERASSDALDFVIKKRENPSLVPDGPNPTEDAALSLNKRHRYQTARYRALNDPEVQDALITSQKARTDRELREALRKHYTLLFAKMRKLDSTIEPLIRERESAAMSPLREPSRATTATLKNKEQQ